MLYPSPLRYPGGKRRLASFMKAMIVRNDLLGGHYAEPYAGGAAIALSLLYEEYVRQVHINDLNRSVFAFWSAALFLTEDLCRRIRDTPVAVDEWHRQRQVQTALDPDQLDLAFSTFYLNRTNRSGIIFGGLIGGHRQLGDWKLDARFNKEDLIARIEKIGRFAGRIKVTNLDAVDFLKDVGGRTPDRTLVYLDPPYYEKGADLYENHYDLDDHTQIADFVRECGLKWIVSYDDHPDISELYDGYRTLRYGINYSAQERYKGSEVMFFCENLAIPAVDDPVCLPRAELTRLTAAAQ